ncbi:Protein of unknown function [Cotesia congregata]|uniref:Uncharacterized protein n=1 Tax=Cotesia congregata TaxID=51543 RepID=A0A8J2MX44_COTCN|nr:Protein of unknown function [Cotesia congregata]
MRHETVRCADNKMAQPVSTHQKEGTRTKVLDPHSLHFAGYRVSPDFYFMENYESSCPITRASQVVY